MDTIEANISTTIGPQHMETVLCHVSFVRNWPWPFYVVCSHNFRLSFSPRQQVSVFSSFVSSRFPDFLVRLQSYHGEPQTLCNIVSHKLSANATQNV